MFEHRTLRAVPEMLVAQKRDDLLLMIVYFIAIFSITPLLILAGVNIGLGTIFGLLAALIGVVLVARWPIVGGFLVLGCVVLIEQNPLSVSDGTDRLPIFYWPPQLVGLIERPIGFLMLLIFFLLLTHRFIKREPLLQGGVLFGVLVFYLLSVVVGVLHGLTSGGDFKIIVVEVRPFWYMFISYLLAYNLFKSKAQVRTFFWLVIFGAGVKGLQGLYIYLVLLHGNLTGQNEIMAHEESFFFVALILLLILFCLHSCYRPQFYTIWILLPPVLVALVANNRRTDYVALLVGVGVALSLIFLVKPKARPVLLISVVVFAVLLTGYVAAFAHTGGAAGAPARAILSVIDPASASARDAASNQYRVIENYDLKYTVKQNPLLGLGFGKPFLRPIPLPDISDLDQYYIYVPHNTIYWIWMRLGAIGYLALWYLFGSLIVRGCLIARQLNDPYLQLVAIYAVAIAVMEIIVGYADYQLFFYRNVIYLGLLAGLLMRLPALDKEKERKNEVTSSVLFDPITDVGGKGAELLSAQGVSKEI